MLMYDLYLEKIKEWAEKNYPEAGIKDHCSFAGLIMYFAIGAYGGYGTESNPYEIRTTQQVLNIGDENFQEMLLEGDNEDLFFELTGDIDLRGHSGYVGTVFSGTLDGNNHTITGSNSIHHIFTCRKRGIFTVFFFFVDPF